MSAEVGHTDVVIVGAGISGIGAEYYLQTECPDRTYGILEGRADLGGTWDLFRYSGIRSDSDMNTLGYQFKPWKDEKAIADGPSILNYVREIAEENEDLTVWAGVACYPAHAFEVRDLVGKASEALEAATEWHQDRIEVAIADLYQFPKTTSKGLSEGPDPVCISFSAPAVPSPDNGMTAAGKMGGSRETIDPSGERMCRAGVGCGYWLVDHSWGAGQSSCHLWRVESDDLWHLWQRRDHRHGWPRCHLRAQGGRHDLGSPR